jgi:prepilin-type N-terminal cleavage/methylation domain-containing protein
MMERRINSRQDGFTLVEVMVATMILGIALGACVLSFSMAMQIVDTTGKQMDTLHDARSQIEMLRTNHFTNVVFNAGTYAISNANYTGNYVVSNVNSWTKDITVNIAYQNRMTHRMSTNTLITSITTSLHP